MHQDHTPRYTFETSLGSRGIHTLMCFREDFTYPFGYLMYVTCGEYNSTKVRADIIDMYVPKMMRRQGVGTAMLLNLQSRVHAIHTPTMSGPEVAALFRSLDFVYNEHGMDWFWYNKESEESVEEAEEEPTDPPGSCHGCNV